MTPKHEIDQLKTKIQSQDELIINMTRSYKNQKDFNEAQQTKIAALEDLVAAKERLSSYWFRAFVVSVLLTVLIIIYAVASR